MVRRLFSTLHREIRGIHEAAYLLGVFAFLSQILAVVRDRLFTHTFGAGEALDIYYTAFRIPDLIFVSIASLVSLSVLVPFVAERLDRGDKSGERFIHSVTIVFFVVMVCVVGIVYVAAPIFSRALFRGFPDSVVSDSLVPLTRIMLLSPLLLGLSNIAASVTQAHRRFFLYALSPLLYNAGIIWGMIFFYPSWGMRGLGWGVVLGAALHLAIQVPFIIAHGFLPRFIFPIDFRTLGRVALLSLPRMAALSASHMVLLIMTVFAARGSEGSVSIFTLAFNLQSVPLAIIGVSYSTAALPTLARLIGNGNRPAFLAHVTVALRHIIFWSLPASVLFIVLRAQIVRVAYGSGQFGWTDTRLTAAALALFAVSMVAQSVILLLTRAYYAAGKTMRPLLVNVACSALIIVLTALLSFSARSGEFFSGFSALVRVSGVSGADVLAFPFAYSLGMLINGLVLMAFFVRDFARFDRTVMTLFGQSAAATLVMGVSTFLLLNAFDKVFNLSTLLGIFAQGFFAALGGSILGVAVLRLMKNRELVEMWRATRSKFWRTPVIDRTV